MGVHMPVAGGPLAGGCPFQVDAVPADKQVIFIVGVKPAGDIFVSLPGRLKVPQPFNPVGGRPGQLLNVLPLYGDRHALFHSLPHHSW